MKVYAFVGRKKSGKDTYAKKLIDGKLKDKKVRSIAFATFIKLALTNMFGVKDPMVFYDQKRKEVEDVFGGHTARDLMCWYGKMMRQKFGDTFFVDIVENQIVDAENEGCEAVVITDVRFKPEVDMLLAFREQDNVEVEFLYIDRSDTLGELHPNADISETSVLECLKYLGDDVTFINNNIPYDQIEVVYKSILG